VADLRESPSGDKRLVAYIVCDAGQHATAQDLRSYLSGELPEYMQPSAVVMLEALPLTANGKIDRRALPPPVAERDDEGQPTAPRSPLEAQIVHVFADLFAYKQVGVFDDFFKLGGHSLLATRVVSRLNSVVGWKIPLAWIFERPTAAGLAAKIEEEQFGLLNEEDLGGLLAELHQLTDEEAEALLATEQERADERNLDGQSH
jgi:hypothetical protein